MTLSAACPSCGAKLRAADDFVGRTFNCPKCRKPVTMTAITPQRILLVSLSAAWFGMVLACGGGGGTYEPRAADTKDASKAEENLIAYEVLYKGPGMFGASQLDVLVAESATKEEVLKLAKELQRQHNGERWFIDIFDSRDTYRRFRTWRDSTFAQWRAEEEKDRRGIMVTKQEVDAHERRSEQLAKKLNLDEEEARHHLVGIGWADPEIKWVATKRKRPEQRRAEAANEETSATESVPSLIETLVSGSQPARKNSAHKLASICESIGLKAVKPWRPKAKEALPELLKLLPTLQGNDKTELAMLLAAIDPKDNKVAEAIGPILVGALRPEHPDDKPNKAILEAIAAIGQPVVDEIFKALEKAGDIGVKNADHRKALFVALQRLGREAYSEENAKRLQRYWTKERYRDVQAEAARALKEMTPPYLKR